MPTESNLYRRSFPSSTVNYVGSSPDPATTWTRISLNKTNTVTKGGGVPGWRQKLAAGENCTTDLVGLEYDCESFPGRSYSRLKRKEGWSPGTYPTYRVNERGGIHSIPVDYPVFSIPGSLVTEASNKAKQDVMKRIISQQQAFQGLVFAGEGRETVRMIQGASQEVDKRYRDFLSDVKKRHRNLSHVLNRRLDQLATMVLTLNYGILPLLSDIDEGAKALATDYSIRRHHKLVTGTGEASGDAYQGPVQTVVAGDLRIYHNYREWAEVVVVMRAMVDLNRSAVRTLSGSNLGFSVQSFIPSVYELIPYSFLLDYFTNVNEIVNAWSYGRTGVTWMSQTIVQKRKRHAQVIDTKVVPGLQYAIDDFEYRPCSLRSSVKSVARATFDGSLVPSLEFELPTSARKLANLAALGTMHRSVLRVLFPKVLR